jgi:hypothetical protein
VIERCLADNTSSWELDSDGCWTRRSPGGEEPRGAQEELRDRHAARAAEHLAAVAG